MRLYSVVTTLKRKGTLYDIFGMRKFSLNEFEQNNA